MDHKKRIYSIKTLIIGLLMILFLASCDNGFEAMNQDPNAYTEPNVGSLFSGALLDHTGSGDGNTIDPNAKQAGCWVQHFSSLEPVEWYGCKYLSRGNYYGRFFETAYQILKVPMEILSVTKDDPDMVNQYNITRILRIEILHRVTDMYGDVPYSEAGLGAIEGNFKPKYDKQSNIYADMLKELEEAANALDPDKSSYGSADFVYNGDIEKWKRFAYSLVLRLGMRLTEVNEQMAEKWVKKAIAGGVMQSNADIALVNHTSDQRINKNEAAYLLARAEGVPPSKQGKGLFKLSQTFISHLKATNDPRLPFYSTLWQGNADFSSLSTYSDPSKQKGLPVGYDHSTISNLIPNWEGNLPEYSEVNLNTICNEEAPSIFQRYSEVEYLLAEAALRGWGPGTPKEHYEKGVHASLKEQTLFPNGMDGDHASAAATQYLKDNPYRQDSFENQMKQIYTQFWVSNFDCNSSIEVYAKWRRTGYPELSPHNYPGNETGGTIPRRSFYSNNGENLNTENYNAAVQRQGNDLLTTRVWWDVE